MACSQCGICCRLFAINLAKEEYFSGKYDTQFKEFDLGNEFDHIQQCGGNILNQKKDGSCIYLHGKSCSIHQIRPQACRDFSCDSKDSRYKKMIEMINEEKLSGGV